MSDILPLADAEIFYNIDGAGEPLLLIPGFASGAWSWTWQSGELSADFSVITFDPRGVGNSELRDGGAVTIEALADDIAALMDSIGVDSAHICGISFGGFVAQEFALKYPAKVRKLVLASTSFGGPRHVAPSAETLAAMASTIGLNTAERIRQNITAAFSPEFVEARPAAVERFCRLRAAYPVPETVYKQQLAAAVGFDAEARVSGIEAETLVITGDRDTVVPAENSRNLANAIPGARLVRIDDSGHMMFVEKAHEFNSVVRAFLS